VAALLSGADGFLHKGEDYTKLPEAVRRTHAGERVWLLGGDVERAEDEVLRSSQEAPLTPRESEVLALVLKRYTNAEISERLSISLQTTKNHVSSIPRKLGKHSRRELF
jgi:DNA-binding NarL/FixJ family response regulator